MDKNKDRITPFVKKRLLLEEQYFRDEGFVNEYLVICRAWEINSKEDIIKNSISRLIDRGNIKVVKTDEKGIRYIKWAKKELT